MDEVITILTALKDKILMGDIQINDIDLINTLIQIEEGRKKPELNPEPISAEGILIPKETGKTGGFTITNSTVNIYMFDENGIEEDHTPPPYEPEAPGPLMGGVTISNSG